MMHYICSCLWAALDLVFAYLLFRTFLDAKSQKSDSAWFLAAAWLAMAIYAAFGVEGIFAYLVYLLMLVLMLLYIFGEAGPQGLCLLACGFLIPLCIDAILRQLSDSLAVLTLGKLLPLLFVLLLRKRSQRLSSSETDDLLLRQHMEMQRESMHALEQNYRLQRKSTHEFEHHMQVLRDLLDQGEIDAAREYLHRLKKNRSIHVMSVSSRHPVVDVILNQKYQTARENDIKMQIRVNDLSAVEIPSDSLVVVLTNLLDNAIEACRGVNDYREIFCSILYDEGLYISIRNTSGEVRIVDGKIPTSKTDALSHGFGLMSVSHILDELEAEYSFSYADGWFEFAAEIE